MTDTDRPRNYRADQLWLADGWSSDGVVAVDASGHLAPTDGPAERLGGWVLPGMPNLHSHAFQRAMAGLAERKLGGCNGGCGARDFLGALAL